MHELLFDQRDSIGRVSWAVFAGRASVPNIRLFETCMSDSIPMQRIRRDQQATAELALRSTPTFLINGVRKAGTVVQATLDSLIREALRGRRSAGRPQRD
jgi:hypothetical protein